MNPIITVRDCEGERRHVIREDSNDPATHAVVKLQLSALTTGRFNPYTHLPGKDILAGDRSGDSSLALGVHRGRHGVLWDAIGKCLEGDA